MKINKRSLCCILIALGIHAKAQTYGKQPLVFNNEKLQALSTDLALVSFGQETANGYAVSNYIEHGNRLGDLGFSFEGKIDLVVADRVVLSWEKKNPARKEWTEKLVAIVQADLAKYEGASDIRKLNANFSNLTTQQKVITICEFWVAVAKFESSWKPDINVVDVGTKDDLGSYSVGLYQMSANDGAAKVYKATFETLKDPLVNIDVALEQMRRQLRNANTIFLPNSSPYRYWAVLLMDNKYSKINEILALVKKNANF